MKLFDTYKERTETNDLSQPNPGVVERLLALHADWLEECGKQTNIPLLRFCNDAFDTMKLAA